jgi:hypothetical protein
LRRHDDDQPAAAERSGQLQLVPPSRQDRKKSVGHAEPQHDSDRPEHQGEPDIAPLEVELGAEYGGGSRHREEADAPLQAVQVRRDLARMAQQAGHNGQHQRAEKQRIQPEQPVRDLWQIVQIGGDGHDAGGHHHRKAGRMKRRELVAASSCKAKFHAAMFLPATKP